MKKLLIVVDMQNDFLLPTGKLSLSKKEEDTTKDLREKVAAFVKDFDGHVLLTQDTHSGDSCEFKSFPEHCIGDTVGHGIVGEIKNALGTREEARNLIQRIEGVISGGTYELLRKSSYTSPSLESFWTEMGHLDPEIHVVGVCTHICVHDITASLVNSIKENFNYIPRIIVHKDLVGDFNPDMASMTLARLQNLYGVKIV